MHTTAVNAINKASDVNATDNDTTEATFDDTKEDHDDDATILDAARGEEQYLRNTRRLARSDEWEMKRPTPTRSGRKTKGLNASYGCSCGPSKGCDMIKSQNDVHNENLTANAKHIADLQALEEKRRHNGPDTRLIDALTFDKANTVASVGGQTAAPEKVKTWRYMELLVDSGAVDNVGDPRAFPEYKLRESDGSRNGLHYLAANNGNIKNERGNSTCLAAAARASHLS